MQSEILTPLSFGGRSFSVSDLELIGQVASEFASLGVTEMSRTICELLEWKRPNGGLKNIECRRLLERLREQGLLRLPELPHPGGAPTAADPSHRRWRSPPRDPRIGR